MFKFLESRMRDNANGMLDFDVASLNALDMLRVRRLVLLLKQVAIECNLKVTFTDYYGEHYHLEWTPSDVPSVEFKWPSS